MQAKWPLTFLNFFLKIIAALILFIFFSAQSPLMACALGKGLCNCGLHLSQVPCQRLCGEKLSAVAFFSLLPAAS